MNLHLDLDTYLVFHENVFIYTKRIEISNIIIMNIQSNPMSSNIGVLIKIYYIRPILFFRQNISRINNIKSRLILIIFSYFKIKDEAALKIHFRRTTTITSSYNSLIGSIYPTTFSCSIYSSTC